MVLRHKRGYYSFWICLAVIDLNEKGALHDSSASVDNWDVRHYTLYFFFNQERNQAGISNCKSVLRYYNLYYYFVHIRHINDGDKVGNRPMI